MSNRIKSLVAYVLLMTPVVARSHPGHGQGGGDFNITHYLTEPWHAPLVLLVFGVLSAVLAQRLKNARWRMQRANRIGR